MVIFTSTRIYCDICLHGHLLTIALVRVFVHDGCIVLPGIEAQDLCGQHWISCEPLGSLGARVLKDYAAA